MTEIHTQNNSLDSPDEFEQRAIDRHPLTQRLNRELLACFKRNAHLMNSKRDLAIVEVSTSQEGAPEHASKIKLRNP
jgi:hypothetical protein